MRHALAVFGVVGALCSAFFSYPIVLNTAANHYAGVTLINLIWGLYYGLGFEPAFIWYKIHGPFPTGLLDVFAMIIYPIIASIFLYWAVFRLSEPPSRRKWIVLVLSLSFLALIPMPYSQLGDWWLHPIWIFGAAGEPP